MATTVPLMARITHHALTGVRGTLPRDTAMVTVTTERATAIGMRDLRAGATGKPQASRNWTKKAPSPGRLFYVCGTVWSAISERRLAVRQQRLRQSAGFRPDRAARQSALRADNACRSGTVLLRPADPA